MIMLRLVRKQRMTKLHDLLYSSRGNNFCFWPIFFETVEKKVITSTRKYWKRMPRHHGAGKIAFLQ